MSFFVIYCGFNNTVTNRLQVKQHQWTTVRSQPKTPAHLPRSVFCIIICKEKRACVCRVRCTAGGLVVFLGFRPHLWQYCCFTPTFPCHFSLFELNIKLVKTLTLFSNNVNTTIRKYSRRAFIPVAYTFRFRSTVQDLEVFFVWLNSPLAENGLKQALASLEVTMKEGLTPSASTRRKCLL